MRGREYASHRIAIDPSKPQAEEPRTGHNRWHEAIEPALEVERGDVVTLETRDAFDGQLTRASTAADAAGLDLGPVHPITGYVTLERCGIPRRISQAPRRLTFFSEPIPRRNSSSLVVDFEAASKPSQTLSWSKSTARMLPDDPSRLGFPTNPRVTSISMNSRGNEVWLGGIVDQVLL